MKKINVVLVISLAIGVIIRLYGLEIQSLGMDELWTAKSLCSDDIKLYMSQWVLPDPHTPIHPVFIFYWTKIFGISEITMRLPSALFGILSVFFCYFLGKKVFENHAQLTIFVTLNSLSTTSIQYSQEARAYALLYFGSVLTTLLLLELIKQLKESNELKSKTILYYCVACFLCSYSHYFGMAYVYTQLVLLIAYLIVRKNHDIRIYCLALFIVASTIGWVIFHYQYMVNMRIGKTWLTYTDAKLVINFIAHVFGRPALYMKTIRQSADSSLYLSYLLIATGPVLLVVVPWICRPIGLLRDCSQKLKNGDTILLGGVYLAVFPFVMFFVLGQFVRIVWVHYLIFLLPPIYFVLSIWIAVGFKKKEKLAPWYTLICGLVIILLWSPFYYMPYKDNARGIVQRVKAVIIKNPNSILVTDGFLFDYYIDKFKLDKARVVTLGDLQWNIQFKTNIDTIHTISINDGSVEKKEKIDVLVQEKTNYNYKLLDEQRFDRVLWLSHNKAMIKN